MKIKSNCLYLKTEKEILGYNYCFANKYNIRQLETIICTNKTNNMKNLLIILAVLFCNIIQAQDDPKSPADTIYPSDNNVSTISGVKIMDVINGNTVLYQINNEGFQIKASAIYRDGTYVTLSSESDYVTTPLSQTNSVQQSNYLTDPEYLRFQSLYESSNRQRRFGVAFTFFGFIGIVAGAVILSDNTTQNDGGGALLYVGGAILFHVGIPLWISGGVRKKNNFNAMQRKKNELSLSLVPSSYGKGIGLMLAF